MSDAPAPLERRRKYRDTGVVDSTELGLAGLLRWITRTDDFRRKPRIGHKVLEVGFFASVVDIGHGMGLALCTDGVGTKVLVAEMLDRYDTVGIDCVAMNVNDAICVGAEPLSFLDYIAVERATPRILEEIGRGLYEGARLAGVNIVGGEISQLGEIIKGQKPGHGLDLVGMCVGIVQLDRVIVGRDVRPGDRVVGLRSSGVHSNGLTLARRALFEDGGFAPAQYVDELAGRVGDELLKPTHIYVGPVLELLREGTPVHALVNITGDGLLNLNRLDTAVGFRLDSLPEPQPIFHLVQESGNVDAAEMYRVFNMGVGFCVIVPNDSAAIEAVKRAAAGHGIEAGVIGEVVPDPEKKIVLPKQGLIGQGDAFTEL